MIASGLEQFFTRLEQESAACGRIETSRAPVALTLLAILAGLYALLPSVFAPPVSVEGFEAAVTNALNLATFGPPAAVPAPHPYLFETRPGEYALYGASTALFGGDALLHGQVWSIVAYLAGLIGTILMARSAGFARPVVAALAYFCLFDVAANVAQASSSNLAMGFLALGGGLFSLRSVTAKAAAVLVLAFAVYCRLDAAVLVPFALGVSLLNAPSVARWWLRTVLAGVAVATLAFLLYSASGVSPVQALGQNQGVVGRFSLYGIKNVALTVFPWTILPPLLGVTFGQDRAWRDARLVALLRSTIVLGPSAVIVFLYLGKLETPRFVASASPFLALGTAMLIERILRSTLRVQLMASAVVLMLAIGTWAIRSPGMTNDGFRYRWATYLTPYERFREKRFLASSAERMIDRSLQCDGCSNENLSVLAINWRAFPEAVRGLILRGARHVGGAPPVPGAPKLGVGTQFRLGDRLVTVYNLDAFSSSVRPSDFPVALDALRAAGRVSVIGSSLPVIKELLRERPGGSLLQTSSYDRLEASSNHVVQFGALTARPAARFPGTAQPRQELPGE